MSDEELCFTPAGELAALIKRGAVSPVEVMRAVLERIDTVQPRLNPFITVCDEQALDAARAAEAAVAADRPLGPLHGVPFSVKDLIDTAGVATTFGSRIHADNVPDTDGVVVARLKQAGAILIGKTTTPEFGHKSLTEAPLFGVTRNPWDTERTSGGSSGGAAVAAACGLGPLAVGTDGGGSIRIPSACCGVVGMKATLGLVPHDQSPYGFSNLSYYGPMTRTVADAALMLDAMAGPHGGDPLSLGLEKPDFASAAVYEGDLGGVRVAWRRRLGNEAVDAETLGLFEGALGAFEDLGAELSLDETPFANCEAIWLPLTYSGWCHRFEKNLDEYRDAMDPSLVESIERGRGYSAVEVQAALAARTALFRDVQGWFDHADLVLTPTLARPAVPLTQRAFDPVEIEGRPAGSLRGAWFPYTHPFNLTGHPAITVPCGWTGDGLPVGLQIVGPWLADDRVLRAAALFEAARPWAHRRPPP